MWCGLGGHAEAHRPRSPPAAGALQCASMWWTDGRAREADRLKHCEEKWNWMET